MPFNFLLDPGSFALGFISGIILVVIYGRIRPAIREMRANWTAQREEASVRRATGVEDNHRRVTLRRAQGMHLAAPLFALDEIIFPPTLIAPPPRVEPGGPPSPEDIVTQTLPYLPSWPELATIYRTPTLSLSQALSGGSNIVIVGMDGSGKTVALAHLASLAANKDPRLGELSEFVPFLIHVADLNLPINDPKDVLNPIIDTAAEFLPLLDQARIPNFIQFVFRNNALLLIDGFDELAPDVQAVVSEYLKILISAYPNARIVTTAIPDQVDGLLSLGFAPLSLMGWNLRDQTEFIHRWGDLWTRFVGTEAWAQTGPEAVDPILLETWLNIGHQSITPLELTLKVWAAFAGDCLGPHVLEAIASHLRRVALPNTPPAALETLAMQAVVNSQMVFDPRKARDWVKSFEIIEENPAEGEPTSTEGEAPTPGTDPLGQKGKPGKVQTASSGLLNKMVASGLLISHSNNRMRFAHPVFGGYLAGRAMTAFNAEEALLNQPNWSGKLLALRYYAAHGNVTHLVDSMLAIEDRILHRPLLTAARWLRDAPRDAAWRGKIMAGLARILQSEENPRSLRAQAMAAFVLCGDPAASAFFRQSLQSLSFELIALAALGSGAIQDTKSVELLSSTISGPSLLARRASCLALVSIGAPSSLESVARALLQGDDDARRAAAEALANDPKDGHEMLRDGATMPDILVRRAVVYGLARVDAPWAVELIQKIQVEDDQWIVRTAATEVIDAKASPTDPRIPRPLTPPSQTPWLIEFAGKQGVGISPGSPATDLLLAALKNGSEVERLAALPYLLRTPNEGVIKSIYHAVRDDDPEMREAAFQLLWELSTTSLALPDPAQFGLG
jgi:HEAT repeat protein